MKPFIAGPTLPLVLSNNVLCSMLKDDKPLAKSEKSDAFFPLWRTVEAAPRATLLDLSPEV